MKVNPWTLESKAVSNTGPYSILFVALGKVVAHHGHTLDAYCILLMACLLVDKFKVGIE